MYPDQIPSRERVQLMNGWSAHLDGGYITLANFLRNAFGLAADRWSGNDQKSGNDIFPQRVPDSIIAETVDAVIAECQQTGRKASDFSYIIGHQYASRTKTAFHNYRVEHVRAVIPLITRLFDEGTNEQFSEAQKRQRDDDLLPYLRMLYEDIPEDFTRADMQG